MTTLRQLCTNLVFVNEDKEEFSELLDSELTPEELEQCKWAGELGRKNAEAFKKAFMREDSHYGNFIGTPDDMPEYGYTSGTHTCKCCECGLNFYGGKSAIRCEICATEYQCEG